MRPCSSSLASFSSSPSATSSFVENDGSSWTYPSGRSSVVSTIGGSCSRGSETLSFPPPPPSQALKAKSKAANSGSQYRHMGNLTPIPSPLYPGTVTTHTKPRPGGQRWIGPPNSGTVGRVAGAVATRAIPRPSRSPHGHWPRPSRYPGLYMRYNPGAPSSGSLQATKYEIEWTEAGGRVHRAPPLRCLGPEGEAGIVLAAVRDVPAAVLEHRLDRAVFRWEAQAGGIVGDLDFPVGLTHLGELLQPEVVAIA